MKGLKNMAWSYSRWLYACFSMAVMGLVLAGCAGSAKPAASTGMTLDQAIAGAAARIDERIEAGSKIALLNFTSPSDQFSSYVLDELMANLLDTGKLTVVDRKEVDLIRSEFDFQFSGEVGDDSMQELGRMLGAQSIVSGSLTEISGDYRIVIRVLNVQSAAVAVQYRTDIANDRRVQGLLAGGRSGGTATVRGGRTQGATGNTSTTGGTVQAPSNATPTLTTTVTYKIGDTGPAGGIIFYDKGDRIGGWRYLEAAPPETERTLIWSNSNLKTLERIITTEESRRAGRGIENTRAIMEIAQNSGGGFGWAVQYCVTLEYNGFNDWFLPSWDELNFMYGNLYLREMGDFKPQVYWSSNGGTYPSGGVGTILVINFNTGRSTSIYNDLVRWSEKRIVRPIRRF